MILNVFKYFTVITIICIALSAGSSASALQFEKVDKICPLCKTPFKARLAMGGTAFGKRLDFKLVGAIIDPWPVAVCPHCHYVLLDKDSEEEINDAELVKIKKYVQSDEYQTLAKTRSSHYLIAKLLTMLGRDDFKLAKVYLQASWQEEDKKEYVKEDLKQSLYYFEAFLKNTEAKNDKTNNVDGADVLFSVQFLRGELLRRLGNFDQAKKHFLNQEKLFENSSLSKVVDYEIRLCDGKDANPHEMREAIQDDKSNDLNENSK